MPKGREPGHVSKLRTGWKPIALECDGQYYAGWRLGNWITWFTPADGWLWDWQPEKDFA